MCSFAFIGTAGQMVTALLDVNLYGQFSMGPSVLKPDGTHLGVKWGATRELLS